MSTSLAPARIIAHAFPGISPQEVKGLIANARVKKHPVGTVLCHEDAVEDTFYFILKGEVEVTKVINKLERRLLKKLGTGDFFGEMALIHESPRAATVTVLKPLTALELRKEDFARVLKDSPSISLAMVREISRRLQENDEMAIDDLRLRAGELAEAYQKMAEMEAARSEFLTNISHQLRTPLMAAGGYLQMLQQGTFPPEAVNGILSTIFRNIQKITSLVNDLLFMQEMELILEKFAPVSMVEMAHSIGRRFEKDAGARGIKIRVRSEPFIPPVPGDALSLERAFVSLVDNAVKFSNDGGDVDIRLRKEKDMVAISITDQGIGISLETLPHIFNRFHHLDRSGDRLFEGLGIGLAIAKQVIEQHNGRLEVESLPGKGSTFTMWLNSQRG